MELGGNGVWSSNARAQILGIESLICLGWFLFAVEV
jgi:hypothetical protein